MADDDSQAILPNDERDRLVLLHGRRFTAGEVLFREGDAATESFLLLEGRVRILKRMRAAERSLQVVRPGEVFGESAILDEAPRRATAVALNVGLTLAMDKFAFLRLIQHYPSVAASLTVQLIRRVRDQEEQVEITMLRDANSKVIAALLNLAAPSVTAAGGTARAPQTQGPGQAIALSPVELSSRAGLDVETVKRAVTRLREQEYVRIVGERVEIPDVDALRRLYTLLGTKEELRGPEA